MRAYFLILMSTLLAQIAAASPKVVAEVFSYPFEPITVNKVHYRLLDSGEGVAVVVRPDGTEEVSEVLTQLSASRLEAILKTIDRVKNSFLIPNPSKESSTCKPSNGFSEYRINNSEGKSIVIAKREYCKWFDLDNFDAKLIELSLDGLAPLNWMNTK